MVPTKKSKKGNDKKGEEKVISKRRMSPRKLARLDAIKRRRRETSEMVKRDLDQKTARRMKLMLSEIKEKEMVEENIARELKLSPDEKIMAKLRKDMKAIVEAGTEGVNASKILYGKIKFDGKTTLTVDGKKYKLKKNVHIIGWGSECMMLAAALEKIIGKHAKKGMIVVPRGTIYGMWNYAAWFPVLNTRIQYFEAGSSGAPDADSAEATKKIADYCKKLKKKDIVVIIVTGGTESLLCCPKPGLPLEDKFKLLHILKASGCEEERIDLCRKKLSLVRGGGLAKLAYPAKVIVLYMLNDSMDNFQKNMGSPVTNDERCTKPLTFLQKYDFYKDLPASVRKIVEEDAPTSGKMVNEEGEFKFVQNYVAASPADAMDDMWRVGFTQGFTPIRLCAECYGSAEIMGREYANVTSLFILAVNNKITPLEFYDKMKCNPAIPCITEEKIFEIFPSNEKWGLGLYLLMGGKCKANVTTRGSIIKGGPNQELALYFSLEWYLRCLNYPILQQYDVSFLGASTSGKDGNSKISGAYSNGTLAVNVYEKYVEICEQLRNARVRVKADPCSEPEITPENQKLVKILEREEKKYKNILPDRVLKTNSSYAFFRLVHDGDECLNIGDSLNYTHTDVGDLHIIRITRQQCDCDGSCVHATCDVKECGKTRKDMSSSPVREKTCKLAFCRRPDKCKSIIEWRRREYIKSIIS